MATEARRVSQPDRKPTVNFIMAPKGGVGKSAIASVMAQYKKHKGQPALCIDTDPANATFFGYQSLNVKRLDIMRADEIDTRSFDQLVELIAPGQSDVIIDNGASSFIPLSHYLLSNHVPQLLQEMGFRLAVHTVITGGQALFDTLNGFSQIVAQFPRECDFIIWLNPYFGDIRHDGKTFEEMKAYKDHRDRITALVTIPTLKEETYGHDFSEMLKSRRTFEEAIPDPSLTIMTRQRLKLIQQQLYAQLDAIPGL